ncbi:AMP-binding protein [Streptomyces sp. NBC_00536]|uniref:AMP-binding protein n=1 Tax=Streptomyces sp. NBC_00536 TaxID=2975769 RepID=UPI002E8026CC|nr:AMP-binding protein [Streptomyces sp. NBC_00536]WUC82672.1 AMP-binding protein [Streptomyces sp. NBC_00536]
MNREPADSVLHRFRRWASATPEAPAVLGGETVVNYRQLDESSSRLAGHLLAARLPPGATVAIGTAHPAEVVTALLAVLKAGGAYTLLDPNDPGVSRRNLAGTAPFALLTHHDQLHWFDEGTGLRVICLDTEAPRIAGQPAEMARTPDPAPGDTAAVVFTGGEEPRAVRIGHARLLAAHDGWAEVAGLTPHDRHLITARPDLVGFATGWTRALCTGGALVLPPRPYWTHEELRRLIRTERVSVVHTDPWSASRLFAAGGVPDSRSEPDRDTWSVRLVTVTGERLHLDEQAALHARLRPGARLLNVYGLTETAGAGAWFELSQLPRPVDAPEGVSLIGVLFPGHRVELAGGEVRLIPPGGGEAIATGDLAREREDGLLEFAGRRRHWIAVGGGSVDAYRIESVIRGHPQVGGVVVRGVPDAASKIRLVAYVAPPAARSPSAESADDPLAVAQLPDAAALRRFLAAKLPEEQIPGTVVRLGGLPRDRAGREDRDGLPLPVTPVPARGARGTGKYGAARGTGKYGASGGEALGSCGGGCGTLLLALVALSLTAVFWPGSTDLSAVPGGYAALFSVLYVFEWLSFGLGAVFLLTGRPPMLRQGRGRALTTAAHLAIVYLLVSWWPQDNFYRLAAKQDWPRQAALVYAFNIPLMIAAGIVAYYATRKPSDIPEAP